METIKLNGINENIYHKKLDNGLDVYLYNKDDSSMLKCNNIKIDNDEIINENGDVYKILSRE